VIKSTSTLLLFVSQSCNYTKVSSAMILPKSVFFSFALSCNRQYLPSVYGVDTECSSEPSTGIDPLSKRCPRGEDGIRHKCMIGFDKQYDELFPGVNAVELFDTSCDDSRCEYCDCEEIYVDRGKSGMTGRECDVEFKRCPDGKQVCFHGAPCVKILGTKDYVCGCPLIPELITFVGEHCEYTPSDFCETDSNYDISKSGIWFCTNNGTCRDSGS